MGNCKNCNTEILGKYCHNCRQRVIVGYDFPSFFRHLLSLIDLQRRFFRTLFYIIFWPKTIINNYRNGITVKYINPVSFFLIIVGLFILLPHIKLLGLPLYEGNKFEEFFEFAVPALITSVIVGFIPYMKTKPIEMIVINLFMGAGFYFFINLELITEAINWKYELHNQFISSTYIISLCYIIYYFLVVFGFHLHKTITNFVVFFVIMILAVAIDDSIAENDSNQKIIQAQLPTWANSRLYNNSNVDISQHSLNKNIQAPVVLGDINGDKTRDVALLLKNSNNQNAILILLYLPNKEILTQLSDICITNNHIVDISITNNGEVVLNYDNDAQDTLLLSTRGLINK